MYWKWLKCPKKGFQVQPQRKRTSWSTNIEPNIKKRRSWDSGFPEIETCKLWWNDTLQWYMIIELSAAFVAKMANTWTCRPTGDTNAWVYLRQNSSHLLPECHLCQLATMIEVTSSMRQVCYLDMFRYMVHFPTFNFPIWMHMQRIPSAIILLFCICILLNEHPLDSILSGVWWHSGHPVCGWEQPSEWTWHWRWAMRVRNGIFEYYYYLQLVDTLKYISMIYWYVQLKNNVVSKEKVNEDDRMVAITWLLIFNTQFNGGVLR
jgi:hypothetical protein